MALETDAPTEADANDALSPEWLARKLKAGDTAAIAQWLEEVPQSEVGRSLAQLEPEDREHLLGMLEPARSSELLSRIELPQASALLEELWPDQAAKILNEMPSHSRADLLDGLSEEHANDILGQMEGEVAEETRRLMAYDTDSAGHLMVTEYLAYPVSHRVEQVIEDMRSQRERYASFDVQYAYVTDADGRLAGVLRLRDLLLAKGSELLENLMIGNPKQIGAGTRLPELHALFDEYGYLGLPVTEEGGRLVGVLQRSAVEEALGQEATDAFLKVSGLVGGEELRSMPLRLRSMRRLSWLTINIGLNIVAASVIAVNQDVLQEVIALAVILPIISDMSGCSGNQAVGVSIRELALNIIKPRDFVRVFLKEAGVGLLNGTILGLLAGILAGLWQQNVAFGLVAGAALMLNTLVAVSLGGVIPLILKGLGKDPALASGPALTTVTDMCGFFLALTFASLMMPYL